MSDLTLPLRSINGDRKVGSAAWRALFATYFTNGIFANPSTNLQVLENGNMTTVVKVGKAHIDGVFTYKRQDTIIQHDIADGLLKRIDRIVLRLDETLRDMLIVLKKGTPGSTPVAPAVQRDAEAYELVLADVFIGNGVTQITQANITDQRLNSALCGVVASTIDQLDTTTLFNQYQSWIEQQKALYEDDLANWTAEQKQEFEQWQSLAEQDFATFKNNFETAVNEWFAQEQQDFETWFATLQNILDENVAATLTAKVQALETGKADNENLTQLQTKVNEHLDQYETLNRNFSLHKQNVNIHLPELIQNDGYLKIEDGKPVWGGIESNGFETIFSLVTSSDVSIINVTGVDFAKYSVLQMFVFARTTGPSGKSLVLRVNGNLDLVVGSLPHVFTGMALTEILMQAESNKNGVAMSRSFASNGNEGMSVSGASRQINTAYGISSLSLLTNSPSDSPIGAGARITLMGVPK